MSAWTGGIANREWHRGSSVRGLVVDAERLAADVRRYLADCRKYQGILSPASHPSERSALKVIYHCTAEEAGVIRAEYRRLTSTEQASLAGTG
jgi:hypothetical protein